MSKSKIRISFMFLGGLPDLTSDSGRAWKNWVMYAIHNHPEYFEKILFVTHPMADDYKLSKSWKKLLGSKIKFYALTKEEHLKTAWATRSLVDATILMIRKSFQLSSAIQKFILLDSTSCPLYNFKVIYSTVMSNRLNWLDSPLSNNCKDLRSEKYTNHTTPGFQCDSSDSSLCFRDQDCSFWSQWCILDVKYLQHVIKANIVKDSMLITCPMSDTKVNQIIAKKTEKTKQSDKIVNATLGAFVDTFYQKPCVASDELYFGMFLKNNRTISQFLDIIFVVKLSALKLKYSEIKPINLRVRMVDMLANPLIGSKTGSIEHVDPSILEGNVNVRQYKKLHVLEKYPFFINPIQLNDRVVKGWYTIPSTYVDWRFYNPDPMNVFRSFHYKGYSICDLINKEPLQLIKLLKSFNGWNETFQSLKMNWIPYWAHPMQYNTRSAAIFLNAYNILEYFSKMGTDNILQKLRDEYKSILKTSMTHTEVGFKDSYTLENIFLIFYTEKEFEFAAFKKDASRKKLGCPINHDILNQARMRGGLFIRKCENGSYIHAFSKQLFETKSYLYQHLLTKYQ